MKWDILDSLLLDYGEVWTLFIRLREVTFHIKNKFQHQGLIMFYNYDLLCTRAGGKFALIWLAATNKKLSFNEIMKVNLHDSCNDIIEVVKMNEPQNLPGKVRPRFSLYLSSMLMYGTCVILRRQCVIVIDQMMTWSRVILTMTSGTKIPVMHQNADDAEKKKGRKRKRNLSANDDSSNKSRLDVIPALTEQSSIPCNASQINPNILAQLNKTSAVLTSPDILQHTECNIQMHGVSTSEIHDEIENLLFSQERQIGNECLEDLNFKIPIISSPTNIKTVETHNVGIELAESTAINNNKDKIDATENVQNINLNESGIDLNKEMQIEECHTSTEPRPADSLSVLQQATSSENVAVNVNHNELMQDGQISSTVMLASNQQQMEQPETSKRVQSKRHLPKQTKRRKQLILEDEETQINKDHLKALTYVLDLELRTQDPEKELITIPESDSFSYFQKVFTFSFADDLTKFFSKQHIKYDSSNLHQTHLDMNSEIQREQKTPTGSPIDLLRMGRGSELPAEATINTSKLHSISESNLEIQDIPLDHPTLLPEHTTKLSEDTNLIPAEVAPVSLVEDKEILENVQGGVMDDRNVIAETTSSKENRESDFSLLPKADEKLLPEQQYEKFLTELQISPESYSNSKKLREKIFKRLKKLLSLKNKIISFQDLCPHRSCTKYEAAVTFKYLLELDMKKKIVLHQDRNIPYSDIHIKIK